MPRVRAQVVISGRVQGVFFRYTLHQEAERKNIRGWVRNSPKGTVEAVLEGEKEDVENLISWCHRGPSGAVVETVEVTWQEYQGEFPSFSIQGWG